MLLQNEKIKYVSIERPTMMPIWFANTESGKELVTFDEALGAQLVAFDKSKALVAIECSYNKAYKNYKVYKIMESL